MLNRLVDTVISPEMMKWAHQVVNRVERSPIPKAPMNVNKIHKSMPKQTFRRR